MDESCLERPDRRRAYIAHFDDGLEVLMTESLDGGHEDREIACPAPRGQRVFGPSVPLAELVDVDDWLRRAADDFAPARLGIVFEAAECGLPTARDQLWDDPARDLTPLSSPPLSPATPRVYLSRSGVPYRSVH